MIFAAIRSKLSKCCCIPQRFILVAMACLAIVNSYTMRISLSMSITEMVPEVEDEITNGSCTAPTRNISAISDKGKGFRYNWTETEQGYILSSFYYGYLLSHLPAGMLSEVYGAKHILGIGLLIAAILTLLTPLIIHETKGNLYILIATRVIIGIGEGPTFPSSNAVLSQWVPKRERSLCGSIVFAGSLMGTIISNLGSGAMIDAAGNWEITFYVFGACGCAWWFFWTLLCYSKPSHSPFISDKELNFLQDELNQHVHHEKLKIPWKEIFTSWPVLSLMIVQFGHDYGWFVMVTDLPKYMKSVLKFNIKDNALWSSLPYIIMWFGALFTGWICDLLIHKDIISITTARKLFSAIGNVGPGIFLVLAVYMRCDKIMAVVMFTIGMGLMSTYYSGMKVNALDLAPNFSGTLMGIVNGMGCLAGIVAPTTVGLIVKHQTFREWDIIFWITFALFMSTTVIYLILASGEVQHWNAPKFHHASKSEPETSEA